MEQEQDFGQEPEHISKTRKKKQAHSQQRLGEELAALPPHQIRQMDIPERLKQALIEGKSISANVAARRHLQYIGVLMRDVDPDDVRHQLDTINEGRPKIQESPGEVQVWMEKLLTFESDSQEECLAAFPDLDRQQLRQLVRNIQKEKAANKPSKSEKKLEELLTAQRRA